MARRYPFLIIASGVSLAHVSAKLLTKLNALGAALGKQITVVSGYRSFAEQKYLWDHAKELGLVRGKTVAAPGHSDHQFGKAVDVTIGGRALGDAVSSKVLRKYGLATLNGDAPHTFLLGQHNSGTAAQDAQATPTSAPVDTPAGAPGAAGASLDVSAVPQQHPPTGPPDPSVTTPPVMEPGSVPAQGFTSRSLADTWRLIAASPLATPDVQTFLNRAEADSAQT